MYAAGSQKSITASIECLKLFTLLQLWRSHVVLRARVEYSPLMCTNSERLNVTKETFVPVIWIRKICKSNILEDSAAPLHICELYAVDTQTNFGRIYHGWPGRTRALIDSFNLDLQ